MKLNIAVLPGDGIGPEIMKQGVAALDAIAEKFNHEFHYTEALCGAHAIDAVGDPFPDDTYKVCIAIHICISYTHSSIIRCILFSYCSPTNTIIIYF